MADIRMDVNEVTLCVKGARLLLHGIRRDAQGRIIDHVDLVLPWSAQRALANIANLDGIDYRSLEA